jgi:hypothetical protein
MAGAAPQEHTGKAGKALDAELNLVPFVTSLLLHRFLLITAV